MGRTGVAFSWVRFCLMRVECLHRRRQRLRPARRIGFGRHALHCLAKIVQITGHSIPSAFAIPRRRFFTSLMRHATVPSLTPSTSAASP